MKRLTKFRRMRRSVKKNFAALFAGVALVFSPLVEPLARSSTHNPHHIERIMAKDKKGSLFGLNLKISDEEVLKTARLYLLNSRMHAGSERAVLYGNAGQLYSFKFEARVSKVYLPRQDIIDLSDPLTLDPAPDTIIPILKISRDINIGIIRSLPQPNMHWPVPSDINLPRPFLGAQIEF